MKKNGGIFAFLLIFLSSIVSAGPVQGLDQLVEGTREVIIIIIQFISNVLLDIDSFDELLFAKILIFTLILLVVYTVIKENTLFKGPKNKPIQWIISSAISILAVRYLPNTFIEAILLQYSSLAVGLTVFLPLIVYFFFIHQSGFGPFGRRAGWIVFATSFIAIWRLRYSELGEANWIYWIGLGFIILSLIFDKSIHQYFGMSSIRKSLRARKAVRRAEAQADLDTLEDHYQKGYYSQTDYNKRKQHLIDVIKKNSN